MEKRKRVLITGASSGIGRDMARDFARRGYDLVLVARNESRLEDLNVVLKTNVQVIVKDLSVRENCIELYNEVGDIDILVNNAGFGLFGAFDETDLETELKLIDTNIVAVHILTKLFLKDMIKKNSGQILNVASIAGFVPGPLMSAYYASKAYILRLSQGIREELHKKKSDVKISVLCPGPVRTNFSNVAGVQFLASSLSSEYVAKYAVKCLLKKKFMIIPSFKIKLAAVFSKFIPHSLVAKFTYHVQKRKEK